jgi:trk system potassium uptake protein TrkH
MVFAEIRGDTTVNGFNRRIPPVVRRQGAHRRFQRTERGGDRDARLMPVSPSPLYQPLFEAISAFGTVGPDRGSPPTSPVAGKIVLVVLMYLGRVGPQTLGAALVLREPERSRPARSGGTL